MTADEKQTQLRFLSEISTELRFFYSYLIDIQENVNANIVFQCTFSLEQTMQSNLLWQCMGQSVAENRYGAVSELGPRDNKSITGPGIYQLKGDLQAYINTKRSANNNPSQATQAIHRVHSMEPFEFLHFGSRDIIQVVSSGCSQAYVLRQNQSN